MKTKLRSHCPINFALETFGDTWSLLIVRDIVFWGKKTYGEFLESKEGIASNVLATRLAHLVATGVLTKTPDANDKRKSTYALTEKGLDLIPMLLEISGWSSTYDRASTAPRAFVQKVYADRTTMFALIRTKVRNGGFLFDTNPVK